MHTVGVRVYDVLVNVRYMYVVDESYNSMISFACYYCVYGCIRRANGVHTGHLVRPYVCPMNFLKYAQKFR